MLRIEHNISVNYKYDEYLLEHGFIVLQLDYHTESIEVSFEEDPVDAELITANRLKNI